MAFNTIPEQLLNPSPTANRGLLRNWIGAGIGAMPGFGGVGNVFSKGATTAAEDVGGLVKSGLHEAFGWFGGGGGGHHKGKGKGKGKTDPKPPPNPLADQITNYIYEQFQQSGHPITPQQASQYAQQYKTYNKNPMLQAFMQGIMPGQSNPYQKQYLAAQAIAPVMQQENQWFANQLGAANKEFAGAIKGGPGAGIAQQALAGDKAGALNMAAAANNVNAQSLLYDQMINAGTADLNQQINTYNALQRDPYLVEQYLLGNNQNANGGLLGIPSIQQLMTQAKSGG